MRSYLEAEGVSFYLKAVSGSRAEDYALLSWLAQDEAKAKIRDWSQSMKARAMTSVLQEADNSRCHPLGLNEPTQPRLPDCEAIP